MTDTTNHLSTTDIVMRALTTPSGLPRDGISNTTVAAMREAAAKEAKSEAVNVWDREYQAEFFLLAAQTLDAEYRRGSFG